MSRNRKGLARRVANLGAYFDDRLAASRFVRRALNKIFPDHWSFMIGEIALYSFVVLLITGIFLTFFFNASLEQVVYDGSYAPLRGVKMSAAYESTLDITFDVRAGLVMRQMHHWAALVFFGAVVVHLCRVFFTGAFRRPREINWMIGVSLMLLVILNGFAGYSLPDDQLSGTGLRIAYSILLSIPLIGTWAAFLLFGGEFPADIIISRLYGIHILLVPAAIAILLVAHLGIMWHQKHTQFKIKGATEDNVVGSPLWPTYAAKSIGLFFMVGGGAGRCSAGWPRSTRSGCTGRSSRRRSARRRSPTTTWAGWRGRCGSCRAWEIRAFGFEIPNPFFPGVLLAGLTFTLLYAWPLLEARFSKDRDPHNLLDRPRDNPMRTALGAATLSFYILLFFAGSHRRAGRVPQDVGELAGVDVPHRHLRRAGGRGRLHPPGVQGPGRLERRPPQDAGAVRPLGRRRVRRPPRPAAHGHGRGARPRAAARGRAGRDGGRARDVRRRRQATVAARPPLRRRGARPLGLRAAPASAPPRAPPARARTSTGCGRGRSSAALVVGGIVLALILFVIVRFRRRGDDSIPSQREYNYPLEITYTIIPLIIVAGLFYFTVQDPGEGRGDLVDAGGAGGGDRVPVGVASSSTRAPASPSSSQGSDRPVLVLPVDQTTRITLVSVDVVHAFYVPEFLYKRDAVPGITNRFDLHPVETGHVPGPLRRVLRPAPRRHAVRRLGARHDRVRHLADRPGGSVAR